ncbi:MAG TPA: FlgD immunoglobulin-like domain containing protein, partial [Myxococcota bacterium]|nr:FlgD immunoglobulin-like domain containing protein [Myxococcota bacterium]
MATAPNDITSDDDVHLQADVTAGSNSITWDGTDNLGNDVPPGSYSCQALITVGEFHYVAWDVETSYDGFRLFLLDSAGTRTGLDMFWNDSAVQSSEVTMANGQRGLESSGASGVNSGTYPGTASANVNARSWGAFQSTSKGNDAFLD